MIRLALVLTAALTIGVVLIASNPIQVSATPQPTAAVTPTVAALVGDAERGKDIFKNGLGDAPACTACHAVSKGGGFTVRLSGPNLQGLGERAGTRVEGLTAEEYLAQSILVPDAFVVDGYANIMFPGFAEHFSEQDTADLVAYLLTL
jgi:cytochrome c2